MRFGMLLPAGFHCLPLFLALVAASAAAHAASRNWIAGGVDGVGTFEQTVPAVDPWAGVDETGFLRKSVAMPTVNPFISRSNQFTYAWLGSSASFVDLDGDGKPEIVSPDGNGIFWCWKNIGEIGAPVFARGEAMPLLIDDLRSEFRPILNPVASVPTSSEPKLSPAEMAARRRVDEKRERELERLRARNERQPKNRQVSDKELQKQVEEAFPYDLPKSASSDAGPTPSDRVLPNEAVPPGGLTCRLNTFRRLRLVSAPVDWNGDGLVDFVAGDSGGTVYLAANLGQPGQPNFGYVTRMSGSIPLKVVRTPATRGGPPTLQSVDFMNYAMPFACDWDRNGVADLLVGEGTYSVNAIRLFRDAARSTVQNPPQEKLLYIGEERTFLAPFAYDWDGDGDLDLFVCDSRGYLTVHERLNITNAAEGGLKSPQRMTMDGGDDVLAYCTPQPCDWNSDGIMDLIWGEPFGRILIALGKSKGGLEFGAPTAVRSTFLPDRIEFPADRVSAAASPARVRDRNGPASAGGTASSERYYRTDGTSRENSGGWPGVSNRAFYGLMPGWTADTAPALENFASDRDATVTDRKQPSWAIAPLAGDIWSVVDEPGAPGEGRTFRLRWHDPRSNAIFRMRAPRPMQWTPGAAVAFRSGRTGPFCGHYTKGGVSIRFFMRLDGDFTRLDVVLDTNWGPLGRDGKPPAEGGEVMRSMVPPPKAQWFEFEYTEPPGEKYERGLDGILYLMLVGDGEVRIRDVRILEAT